MGGGGERGWEGEGKEEVGGGRKVKRNVGEADVGEMRKGA